MSKVTMNTYLLFIIAIIFIEYGLDLVVEIANMRHLSCILPKEFEGFYDAEKYKRSQEYTRVNTWFGLVKSTYSTVLILFFILVGGFALVDQFVRSLVHYEIVQGLLFGAVIMGLSFIVHLPFSVYRTFVIEQEFGFNRTTIKTFIMDIIKGICLGALIGGVLFSGIIWFFQITGKWAWVVCWIGVGLFELGLTFIAPIWIMPLFNKFIPLEEGELKKAIEQYAASQHFAMKGIFKIDASRRSSKSNAFFTGFGKSRRIALYDTLITKHTTEELVAVLAHEIGHYKKGHIIKQIILSLCTSGVMFFILSLFMHNQELCAAFNISNPSIYASLFFFGFLYAPINFLFSIGIHMLSRRYEYQADAFAVTTYHKPEAMINALRKLTVDNLSNLTPHPWKVALSYSHPPVLERIKRIRDRCT